MALANGQAKGKRWGSLDEAVSEVGNDLVSKVVAGAAPVGFAQQSFDGRPEVLKESVADRWDFQKSVDGLFTFREKAEFEPRRDFPGKFEEGNAEV
jgi:hypothetical protein